MSGKDDNFLRVLFETRSKQELKGELLQKDVKVFQEIERLKEEIGKNFQHIIDSNFPPILARLDQIQQLLVVIGQKVDMSEFEKEILSRLMDEVTKKK